MNDIQGNTISIETLNNLIKCSIESIEKTRLYAIERNLLNSQEYLNFEDILNRFSVMDPNK